MFLILHFNVAVKLLLILLAMKENESLVEVSGERRKKWMFCMSNAIGWGEDRGGSAHRIPEGHEQKTKSKCFQKSQFWLRDGFLMLLKVLAPVAVVEDGVLGHRFNPEFIYFF